MSKEFGSAKELGIFPREENLKKNGIILMTE